ncbi:hypothetical protein GOBAR_AA23187 [Gossypium barbadense]|uniref:Uncharacterized protein n=1 Tax=Gossypium barbadense TaxID=3634 RepID=A0A2P5X2B7_GOSBA|nr:hypothetical protein GOBAR_AA23187 [Gossypium barbadense]
MEHVVDAMVSIARGKGKQQRTGLVCKYVHRQQTAAPARESRVGSSSRAQDMVRELLLVVRSYGTRWVWRLRLTVEQKYGEFRRMV